MLKINNQTERDNIITLRFKLLSIPSFLKSTITLSIIIYFVILSPLYISAATTAKISIIIDDVGDSRVLGFRAAKLPKEVALSILPQTPYSNQIATFGHLRGMDILLHQPMESLAHIELLGPGALYEKMDRQDFNQTLSNNLDAIPFVVGVNNHMGSLLTTDQEKMNWLMAELSAKELFFVDSRTTAKSVAAVTAENWQIPSMSRMIFLDHLDEPDAIAKQFQRLIKLARKYGHATAIGHPRKNTLLFLEQNLANLESQGVILVSPSSVLQSKSFKQRVPYSADFLIPILHSEHCVATKVNNPASIREIFSLTLKAICTD